ncbi:MAG: tetratricopeptide repeat protein [Leptolyngbya sp. Prado105]|jgi:tetratricopeptide (TPR) repeat protein|nr:tetratricopeptide repeat protein [Leptolyngbya sp. Prado105]
MQQKKFLEVFDSLPTKRKQVLLAILQGDTREKIMADVGVSEDALTQHRRQLYKDFQIEVFQNEADDPRSGERKLPQLIALFAKYKPDLIAPNASLIAPAAPTYEPTWVERPELTTPLLQVLQGECRVLALTGITGIGKTDLAKRLVTSLQDDRSLYRLNLDDGSITAEFSSGGAALLRSLGEEPTLADQQDPQNLLAHLLQLLRTQPHRVQIDSMERLLKGNDREGWSEFDDRLWGDLFQQLLAGNECQSQLILTTQDLPGELESVGSRYPQVWYCQPVRGLNAAEQLELFEKRGLPLNDSTTAYLQRMGKLYEGHPLVLRVIAEDIKACGGNVRRYWQQGQFEELEANRPANLSRRKLQLEVKHRVKAALERLPSDALQLLCRSAVYRRPVPPSFWLAMLPVRSHLEAAIELLKARSLAEEDWEEGAWLGADGEIPLRQHNLIRSVAYERLKADEAVWRSAERSAAEQWLNHYEAVPEATNLEQVRGYLEAFDHYCNVEDWQQAKVILFDQKIGLQLQAWSHYQEMLALCGKLINHLEATDEVACLRGLGNAYFYLSKFKQASDYYQQSLGLAREIGDRQGHGRALNNLANVYRNLGDSFKAIEYLEQALSIAHEIGDRKEEGIALGNLGGAYYSRGNYGAAIEFFQQDLTIAREIGNRLGEGSALGNLGIAHHRLGEYGEAIEFHQQHLTIAREVGHRKGESNALGNVGIAYDRLGEYGEAIKFFQQHLAIAREIGDQQGEGNALGNLGIAYDRLGDYGEAIEFFQQHAAIAGEVGDRRGESIGFVNWGHALVKLGQYSEALPHLQVSLKISQDIGDRDGEAEALLRLAELHQKTGLIGLARQECDRALAIATELGIPLVKECEELKELIISSTL